jgi:hypothetical protein
MIFYAIFIIFKYNVKYFIGHFNENDDFLFNFDDFLG